ncbi:MAG: sigma-54-dependent Fis family transcriptional regulator [Deltaproteobacteria bacterium]|nr:sigma-54-dependent Fis family transcriptional regulator [Deltaproteobacteria bacterium]MBW2414156.1 sigma-54-dependent Fis family transcriptional regulator [Deltaproteobacteria bacterium]
MNPRILVAEDERAIQLAIRGLLRREGYEVELADNGEAAIRKIRETPLDLVLTDLALGQGPSGMDVLRFSKEHRPEAAVVMITAHGTEKIAVEAMKLGAEDYVPKPFDNEELRVVVKRALERTRLQRENRMLLERVERDFGFENLIGSGPAMKQVFETIQKVAETDLSVLIRGESGTGKEGVAQALHQRSSRRTRPFVAVNCAAISKELVESELFGHEKGAFTGADARRIGKFEAADEGTIFLDEIGDMPQDTQAKVLRVLQEKAFERVGGNREVEVDVRVVAATHRDLEEEVRAGRFREDLYYRLNVVEIAIPPLRERVEDIPALAERFLTQVSERLDREKKTIDADAVAALARHAWRGNVRELRNAIEQASVLSPGQLIGAGDLRLGGLDPAETAAQDGPGAVSTDLPFRDAKRSIVERFERGYLIQALRSHGGNISRTAEAIGMVRQSLQQKIRELGLRSDDWNGGSGKEEGS